MPGHAWHRNQRRNRQSAKGIVETEKLGLEIPPAAVAAAKQLLAAHHGTDKATMQTWDAQRQMQHMMENISSLNYMLTGNHRAAPNQNGMTPWGKGGIPGGKGGFKGGFKGGGKGDGKGGNAGGKVGGGKGEKQQRKHRDLAEDVVAFTGEANVQHSSIKLSARIATNRDI